MSSIRQTNFGGGEIAPLSWGRNDLSFFARGLRTMRNFFPTRSHGSAVSRPGSLYIGVTKNPIDSNVRLLPFVYSDTQSYVLEVGLSLGQVYFRFYQDGAQLQATYLSFSAETTPFTDGPVTTPVVVTGGTSGATARIVSVRHSPNSIGGPGQLQVADVLGVFLPNEPLTDSAGGVGTSVFGTPVATGAFEMYGPLVGSGFDIRKTRFAQTGDILTLANPLFLPFELRRLPNYLTEPHWGVKDVVFKTANPFFNSSAGGYPVILESSIVAADATHPTREWTYLCTLTVQETATGRIFETAPWRIVEKWDADPTHAPTALASGNLVVYPDKPITIRRDHALEGAGAPGAITVQTDGLNVPNLTYREIAMNIYRGRGKLFGLVGTTATNTFIDGGWSPPAPGVVNAVGVGAEPNYAVQPPLGDNPFLIVDYLSVAALEYPAAVAFFQDRRLFAATPSRPASVFASATGDYANFDHHALVQVAGEALEFELAARRFEQVKHLVSHQKTIIGTGSSVWSFAGAGGAPLDFDSVDAKVIDEVGMTDLTPLMFEGRVLYGRAKGTGVRGLFFDATYGTYSGLDLSGQADHLFIGDTIGLQGVTNRELLDWTYAEDPWGLVWAVRRDGALLSLTLKGQEYGWARHDGGATARSLGLPPVYKGVCSVPEGDEDAVYVLVQRAIEGPGGTLLDDTNAALLAAGFASPAYGLTCVERMTSRVRRANADDDACVDCGLRYEGPPVLTITGLDHLIGESVWVIGVGNAPQGPLVVTKVGSDYQVTLGEMPVANQLGGTVVLFAGLLFTPDLETLDVVSADSKMKQKAVVRIGFEVDQSAGILAGEDFDHLMDSRPNTVASGYGLPVPGTSLITVVPSRKWGIGGRAVLRQSLPLPVTVVGLTRELEVGG